jgi:hypothetical protein
MESPDFRIRLFEAWLVHGPGEKELAQLCHYGTESVARLLRKMLEHGFFLQVAVAALGEFKYLFAPRNFTLAGLKRLSSVLFALRQAEFVVNSLGDIYGNSAIGGLIFVICVGGEFFGAKAITATGKTRE